MGPRLTAKIDRLQLPLGELTRGNVILVAIDLVEWAWEKHRDGYALCAVKIGESVIETDLFGGPSPITEKLSARTRSNRRVSAACFLLGVVLTSLVNIWFF